MAARIKRDAERRMEKLSEAAKNVATDVPGRPDLVVSARARGSGLLVQIQKLPF